MADPAFFERPTPVSLSEVLELTGAKPVGRSDPDLSFVGVAPVGIAGPDELCMADGARYVAEAAGTNARACFCTKRNAEAVSAHTLALVVADPHVALAAIAARLYPSALRPRQVTGLKGVSEAANVDPSVMLETDVVVEAGAVIGPAAEIGRGSRIGPNVVIGPHVRVGRDCSIGPNATIRHSLVGDRVIVHPGVHIGQDGFGFLPSSKGHAKIPQVGRVIIQDDVEIGAGTTIDRGASGDTVIGEGTKIDNQVQIGHNVAIGRHCIIVAQVGISGSVVIEDHVMIGGHSAINGHTTVGAGSQIGAFSGVYRDIPGGKWAGAPARPLREWLRAMAAMPGVARDRVAKKDSSTEEDDG